MRLALLLLIIGLCGYLLPWIVAPSSAMTLNAYDLAEWTSLHPLQQSAYAAPDCTAAAAVSADHIDHAYLL